MAQDHSLMSARYELKYLMPARLVLQVRDFLQPYLELDEYCVGQPNLSYTVHSLYLDTDDWVIFGDTVGGDKNRFKLRVRYYNDDPRTPVFFEIKRRQGEVILKQRCGIWRGAEQRVLAGHWPEPERFVSREVPQTRALQEFIRLMLVLPATPKMHVAYEREAYVRPDNNDLRVTIDRFVRGVPRPGGELIARMEDPLFCITNIAVLELKFSRRFPNWYQRLVETFDLVQCGAAKYVECTILHQSRDLPEADIARRMVL